MNEVPPCLPEMLFASLADVVLTSVDTSGESIRVAARSAAEGAACPGCGSWSRRVHGSYLRFPGDLPVVGKPVVVALRVRRFTCATAECPRRTFVEQVPGLTRRHGRWTERLRSLLGSLGLALAGRAAGRLAELIGVRVSRSTVLRVVQALPEPSPPPPTAVGVDEFALRKGRVYGTVLVDVESRRPVELLPDREPETLAAWLAQHPQIKVVCRDRAPFYAEGAALGAPQALQVADRWHLWHNLGQAAERCVSQHRTCLRAAPPTAEPAKEPPAQETPASPWPTGHRFADRIRARHSQVHALLEAGHSRRSIQRQLRMTYRTVKQLADALVPEELFRGQWQNRPTRLDAFKPYLHQRWEEGCTNAWKLWEEITEHGYRGGYGAVRDYLRLLRTTPRPPDLRPPSVRTVSGWLLTHPDALREDDRLRLKAALADCPELQALTGHIRAFARMLTQREGEQIAEWIAAVREDDLPSLHTFASGLERDLDAVTAGLSTPWNSGVVEGHVNRIKMLKRQMFGRAGFTLLRKRVLLAR
ncbi:ISL3 family transposase [Streptomyces olindensis]|uniref:ISL3 family transposase n=1 Tax=Streptomyces olindensis TaxID=358823 RepID=UPI0036678E3A